MPQETLDAAGLEQKMTVLQGLVDPDAPMAVQLGGYLKALRALPDEARKGLSVDLHEGSVKLSEVGEALKAALGAEEQEPQETAVSQEIQEAPSPENQQVEKKIVPEGMLDAGGLERKINVLLGGIDPEGPVAARLQGYLKTLAFLSPEARESVSVKLHEGSVNLDEVGEALKAAQEVPAPQPVVESAPEEQEAPAPQKNENHNHNVSSAEAPAVAGAPAEQGPVGEKTSEAPLTVEAMGRAWTADEGDEFAQAVLGFHLGQALKEIDAVLVPDETVSQEKRNRIGYDLAEGMLGYAHLFQAPDKEPKPHGNAQAEVRILNAADKMARSFRKAVGAAIEDLEVAAADPSFALLRGDILEEIEEMRFVAEAIHPQSEFLRSMAWDYTKSDEVPQLSAEEQKIATIETALDYLVAVKAGEKTPDAQNKGFSSARKVLEALARDDLPDVSRYADDARMHEIAEGFPGPGVGRVARGIIEDYAVRPIFFEEAPKERTPERKRPLLSEDERPAAGSNVITDFYGAIKAIEARQAREARAARKEKRAKASAAVLGFAGGAAKLCGKLITAPLHGMANIMIATAASSLETSCAMRKQEMADRKGKKVLAFSRENKRLQAEYVAKLEEGQVARGIPVRRGKGEFCIP